MTGRDPAIVVGIGKAKPPGMPMPPFGKPKPDMPPSKPPMEDPNMPDASQDGDDEATKYLEMCKQDPKVYSALTGLLKAICGEESDEGEPGYSA